MAAPTTHRARETDAKPAAHKASNSAAKAVATARNVAGAGAMSRMPSPQVAAAIIDGAQRTPRVHAQGSNRPQPAPPSAKAPTPPRAAPRAMNPVPVALSVVPKKSAAATATYSATAATATTKMTMPMVSAKGAATAAPLADANTAPHAQAILAADVAAPEKASAASGRAVVATVPDTSQAATGTAEKAEVGGASAASTPGAPPVAAKAAEGGAPETRAAEAAAPSPREAVAPAVGAVRHRAAAARQHGPAGAAVASAQASAVHPQTEQVRGAAVETVGGLDAAKADAVRRGEFKAKLKKAIQDATPQPKTEAEANTVMKEGGTQASGALRGQLATERDAAAGPMKSAAANEAPASGQPAPPETALQVQPPGPVPVPVSAAPVVPAPLPAQRLDYSADHAPTEQVMAQNNVTPEQLKKGNDPAFGPTLDARSAAEKHEATAAVVHRGQEAEVQADAQAGAQVELAQGLGGIHGGRVAQLANVGDKQLGTAAKDAAQRKQVTDDITAIKDKTKAAVETILDGLDTEAAEIFERGLEHAEAAYDAAFEEAKGGIGTWLTTWGSDWDKHIAGALGTARSEYMRQVDAAIDEVADFVDRKIKEAKDCVATGRQEVDTMVAGLDANLRQAGEEAREAVSGDFDAMGSMIDERRDALVDKLAQQYKDSYERMSARETELRDANKSLWQRVYDATVGLVKQIIAFKDTLLGLLGRAAGVINDIIADPIGFLGNLVTGVMAGLKSFISNIGSHLKKGLMDWLFGALSGAGLTLPDTFDLKGILSIVLQILGLTYANFRKRAVTIVGEPIVGALEETAEVFKVLITEGVGGLWRFIKEKVADLKAMVLDAIFDFIKEKVIIAGVTWIIGLLNPASAFFKACKAIYDIVMFFINRGSQIMSLVNAVVDSMAAIVKGTIGVAATFVENALAKAVPVAIGFLAGLLGLGDPSKPVRNTMEKAQSPVNKAIDWVINQAVKFVKAAGKLVKGLFGKKDKGDKADHEDDPKKAAQIEAGLVVIDREDEKSKKNGALSREDAEAVAAKVKGEHPVFKSITVVEGKDTWDYDYVASPERRHKGAHKASGQLKIVKVNVKDPNVAGFMSRARMAVEKRGLQWAVAAKALVDRHLLRKIERRVGAAIEPRDQYNKLESAQYEARLNYEKNLAAKVNPFSNVPDATAEIMTPPGQPKAVAQVVVFEFTVVEDFYAKDMKGKPDKFAMHKITQYFTTVSNLLAKYGSDVPITYYFVAPREPTDDTKDYIAGVLRDKGATNITVVWIAAK